MDNQQRQVYTCSPYLDLDPIALFTTLVLCRSTCAVPLKLLCCYPGVAVQLLCTFVTVALSLKKGNGVGTS